MSVTIRLSRIGKTRSPAFKIVAATTRDKMDGRAIEVLGHYNPSHNPPLLKIDKGKIDEWKKKGAIISPAVAELVEDKYEFKPYTRQNEMKDDDDKAKEIAENAAVVEEVEAGKVAAAEETPIE